MNRASLEDSIQSLFLFVFLRHCSLPPPPPQKTTWSRVARVVHISKEKEDAGFVVVGCIQRKVGERAQFLVLHRHTLAPNRPHTTLVDIENDWL